LNKPKAQGTAAETRIVKLHKAWGLLSRRIAEGGIHDKGDVEIWSTRYSKPVIGEVKDKERPNTGEALDKAVRKSGTQRTALFITQRISTTTGIRRRTIRYVAVPESFWLELIGGREPNEDGR
jgi:hypothetical protein